MPKGYKENLSFGLPAISGVPHHSTDVASENKDMPDNVATPAACSQALGKTKRLRIKMSFMASWFSKKGTNGDMVPIGTTVPNNAEKRRLRFWNTRWRKYNTTIVAELGSQSLPPLSSCCSCFSVNDCISSAPTFALSQSEPEDSSSLDTRTVMYRPLVPGLDEGIW